ncbi:DUF2849 domain-containing protein [Rhizobium alvei]|jgi:hypothetical protein|uniref:DUF2849 domain-containing protein n=1 Tax=Rhizobium alvei TaxID=1132659 RepID=A0ABT8YPM9_9HYPH|nr:DUF2849 domain-containing protein [Rhizobium alvei]MDO6965685.1 DUF2849 domain-containing protein [Rhizobium alvei]
MTLQVLTANRLTDGITVWYAASGDWSESFSDAEIVRSKEDAARLEAIGKQAYADNFVLDVNLIDVEEVDGRIRPQRMRERIRAEGPSIDYLPANAGTAA